MMAVILYYISPRALNAQKSDISSGGSRIPQTWALTAKRGVQPMIWPFFLKTVWKWRLSGREHIQVPVNPLNIPLAISAQRNQIWYRYAIFVHIIIWFRILLVLNITLENKSNVSKVTKNFSFDLVVDRGNHKAFVKMNLLHVVCQQTLEKASPPSTWRNSKKTLSDKKSRRY